MIEVSVAIVGATGSVGETAIKILEERSFPIKNLYLLASERSVGNTILFNGKNHSVENLAEFDFSKADIAIFSAGSNISAEYAPVAASSNCIVIDNTSHFRYEKDIPLVIPEINPEEIGKYKNRNIIANPNCSTIQMLVALWPIYQKFGIEDIQVSTYQSVSGAGKQGISELIGQLSSLLNGKPKDAEIFQRQIAFNAIPQIDVWQENGFCKEEMKMVWETKKIFNDDSIWVNPTTVRVPTCYGHAESVSIKTKTNASITSIAKAIRDGSGVELMDDKDYPTPFEHGTTSDSVYVGRLRQAIDRANNFNMWIVADNIRKGAALNAVQIAEVLVSEYL